MKRSTRHRLAFAIATIGLWIAAGCTNWQPPPPAQPLPTATQPRPAPVVKSAAESTPLDLWASDHYTDLPVSDGYEYISSESFVFAQEGIRSADLRYEGEQTVEELIRFFQESLPANGWRFLRLTGMRMKTVTFTKQGEMCEIIVMSTQPGPVDDNEWQTSPRVLTTCTSN